MMVSSILLTIVLASFSPDGGNAAHSGPLKTRCIDCHARLPLAGGGPALRGEIGEICSSCHPRHHGADAVRSHPLNRVPSMPVPPDMLLDDRGRMTCVTCHAFHGTYRDEEGNKRYYLRRTPGKTFCFSCHKTMPGIAEPPK